MDKVLGSQYAGNFYSDWLFDLAFDDLGAYLVETNEGHYPNEGLGTDNDKDIWQASAYATDRARLIAQQYYSTAPQLGYINGCSGGGMRSASSLEHEPE